MQDLRSLTKLQDEIRSLASVLADRYQVESITLFGSYVREEQRPGSDLDVLVTFRETPSLFEFLQLEYHLRSGWIATSSRWATGLTLCHERQCCFCPAAFIVGCFSN